MASPPSSNSQGLPPLLPDLNATFGAALIGMVAAALLFGVCNLQLYIYYQKYPKDWILYRASVAIIWILDGINLGLVVHCLYHYLISSFGDYAALGVIVWSFKLQVTTNVIIVVIVHILYSLRVWRLNSRATLLPILLFLIVIAGAGVGVALIVETYKTNLFSDMARAKWVIYASYASAAFVDCAIAGTMSYYLYGSRTEFATTNSKISALILWTLSTGLVTSVCSLCALVVYAALPSTLVFLAFEFVLAKLYFNSLLAMLNDRKRINDGSNGTSFSVSLSHPRSPRDFSIQSAPGSTLPSFFTEENKQPDFLRQHV